jgi:hypothetical protein
MAKPYDLEQLKLVLARHSRVCDAAREIGLKPEAVVDTFRRRGQSAASFLAGKHVRVPEGHEVKSVTTTEGPDGELIQQSTKTQQVADKPRFEPLPPDHTLKGLTTALGPAGDIRWQWVMARQGEADRWAKFWDAASNAAARYAGLAGVVKAPRRADPSTMTIYNLGDPHIGMLAWAKECGVDFDTRIAERELFGVVDMLVERAPASHEGVLANLGDFLHAQNDKQLTPHGGNKLDVDGRSAKVNEIAFGLMTRLVDRLRQKHKRVRVVTVPGNHDPDVARMLAIYLRKSYENEPRVEILPNWNPFTYLEWGQNLFGWAHGDGAKPEVLPKIMAEDMREAWGRTWFHCWHTGHEHQKRVLEVQGTSCLVETHRTVAANDGWAHWKGYRSGKSLSAITYAFEGGEISRQVVDLRVARSRIAARVKATA